MTAFIFLYHIGEKRWINNKKLYLGAFDTPEQAFQAYKEKKEWTLKQLAFKWGEKLDPRAERALYQYSVDIND